MKTRLQFDRYSWSNYGGCYENNPQTDNGYFAICGDFVEQFLEKLPYVIEFDARTKNPKKKGFKKIGINSERTTLKTMDSSIYSGRVNLSVTQLWEQSGKPKIVWLRISPVEVQPL